MSAQMCGMCAKINRRMTKTQHSYLTVLFGDLFDQYADAWDNYHDDSNVIIVFYEDLKTVRDTMSYSNEE